MGPPHPPELAQALGSHFRWVKTEGGVGPHICLYSTELARLNSLGRSNDRASRIQAVVMASLCFLFWRICEGNASMRHDLGNQGRKQKPEKLTHRTLGLLTVHV